MDRVASLRRARAPFAAGDPLRGTSALAVALGHIVGIAVLSWLTHDVAGRTAQARRAFGTVGDVIGSWGTLGVAVFFVLSGYLLSRPFVRAAVLGEPRPSLRRYARNRILRIVPAYWAVVLLVAVTVILPGVEDLSAGKLGHVLVFDGTLNRPLPLWFGHLWTLDVEMRFYIGLAVVGTLFVLLGEAAGERLGPRGRIAVLAAAAVGLAAWSFLAHPVGDFFLATSFRTNVGRFAPGILLAVIEVGTLRLRATRGLQAASVALFAGGIVALAVASIAHEKPFLGLAKALGDGDPWLMTAAAGAVVAGPLLWQWAGGRTWRALDNPVLHWAGERSYSLYLIHVPIYAALVTIFDDQSYQRLTLLLATVGFPLALVAAEGLHRWVEVPFLRRRAPSQVVTRRVFA